MTTFSVGAAVLRKEDRLERRATITEIVEGPDGASYRLSYAEGGEGWWPEEAIEADEALD